MKLKNLIGYSIDTNQFTSNIIESVDDAKMILKKLFQIYNIEIIDYMFLTDNNRITSYKKEGVSLSQILNKDSNLDLILNKKCALDFWSKLPMYNMDKTNKRILAARYFQTEQSLLTIEQIVFIYKIES